MEGFIKEIISVNYFRDARYVSFTYRYMTNLRDFRTDCGSLELRIQDLLLLVSR